jgi:hypothetical protein
MMIDSSYQRKGITMKHDKALSGFFRDDGTEIDPAKVPKPELCRSCRRDGDPKEGILCILTRDDQEGAEDFVCHAYVAKTE